MLFLVYLFLGKNKVRITSCDIKKIINGIIKEKINTLKLIKIDDDTVELILSNREYKRLLTLSEDIGFEVEKISNGGLPAFFSKYKRRYGLYAGALLFLGVVFISTQFVWRVDVIGNENLSREEVIEILRQNGIEEGSYIPAIDVDYVQHNCVLSDERLAWVSINRIGTIVTAEIRERLLYEEKDGTEVNVVSKYDGQIESIEVYNGTAVVNVGDSVRRGDLLISGIVDGNASGLRQLAANGKVMARVSETVRVEIPFENEEKQYTGEIVCKNRAFFFGNYVNLFINSGISLQKYDTIINKNNFTLYDGTKLPIGLVSEFYKEYETVALTYSPLEAQKIASAELGERTAEILSDAELLARSQSSYFTDTSYVIECELYVLRDIAKALPIGKTG